VAAIFNKLAFSLLVILLFFISYNIAFTETPCPDSDDLIINWLQEQTTVEQA